MQNKKKSLWVVSSAVCLSLCTVLYLTSHLDRIMVLKGDYCLKRNKTEQAIKYYEAAFDYGLKDYKVRDSYVNILINSPLTISAQEKLEKLIESSEDDAAKLKAEYFLYDIRKELYRKYDGNYIKQAPQDGKIIRWGKLPITYGFVESANVPEYFYREIENAFSSWEKSLDHLLIFERDDKAPNILIDFKENNTSAQTDKKYIIAYTRPQINTVSILKNMDITFYLRDPENKYYPNDMVYSTAMHEIVHALGIMGHSGNKEDIMYMSSDTKKYMKEDRLKPSDNDINTIKLLYNIKPDITNADGIKAEYTPYVALGNDKEVFNSKIREAKLYIKKVPYLPNGYIDLANAYIMVNDYGKAVKSLDKALQLAENPLDAGMIYYNLAVCYYYMSNYDMAEEYLKKSLDIKDNDEKHRLLAEIYLKTKRKDYAIEEYRHLIMKNPKNEEYAIALANIYIKDNHYLEARKVLKEFFKINPEHRSNPRFAPYGILKFGI